MYSHLLSASAVGWSRQPNGGPGAPTHRQPSAVEEHCMSNVMAVTDANFEDEVEKAEGLTIVDFWATWCGPCRMVAPILDQLATDYQGKVKVTKLDVDANIRTGSRFNVRSIPTLLFFKGGKVVDQIIGAVPKANIEAKLQQHALPAQHSGAPQQHTA